MNEKQILTLLHGQPIREYSVEEYIWLKKLVKSFSWLTKSGNPLSYLCHGAHILQQFKLACATSVNGTPSPSSPKDLVGFNGAYRYHNTYTFDGVTYAIPCDATLLDYATFDGSSYVTSALTSFKNTYKYSMNIKKSVTTTTFVFGQNPSSTDDNIGMYTSSNGYQVQNGASTRKAIVVNTTSFHDIILEKDGVTVDGTKTSFTQVTEFTVAKDLLIGSGWSASAVDTRCFNGQMASFCVHDENDAAILVAVPVKKADGTITFFDCISQSYLTVTGTLTAGNEIAKGLHQWGRTENLWDKSLSTTGWVNGSGVIVDYPNGQAQMSDYVECDAGDQFTICGFYNGSIYTYGQKEIAWFNSSKTFLSRDSDNSTATSFTAVAPTNAKYCKFGVYQSIDTTVITHDAVAIKGSTAPSTYIPYYSYNGNKGKAVAYNCGRVDLGTLSWTKYTSGEGNKYRATVSDRHYGTKIEYVDGYTSDNRSAASMLDKTVIGGTGSSSIYIRDDAYADADSFKNAMSGVYLYYQRTTDASWNTPQFVSFPDIVNGNIDLISGSGSDEWSVKVFDGTESWDTTSVTNCYSYRPSDIVGTSYTDRTVLCNYYQQTATLPETSARQGYCFKGHNGGSSYIAFGSTVAYTTVALWNAHLKELYDAGTPVIAVYKKSTASAITCTAVSVTQTDGTNTAEARNCNDVVNGTLTVKYYGKEA